MQLSPDRFGIQVFNTYVVRIADNGVWILNWEHAMTQGIAAIIAEYSPVKIKPQKEGDEVVWIDQHNRRFVRGCWVVDADGVEQGKPQATHRKI